MDALVETWRQRSDYYLEKASETKDKALRSFYAGTAITLMECAEEMQRSYEREKE